MLLDVAHLGCIPVCMNGLAEAAVNRMWSCRSPVWLQSLVFWKVTGQILAACIACAHVRNLPPFFS